MPLVRTDELFKKAYKKYAIGAFNVNNMEILQGVIEAAKKLYVPVIHKFQKVHVTMQACLSYETH